MHDQRKLVVVSGPSGCGKDTVVKYLMMQRPDVQLSVSCTTRKPRVNESEGVDYYFLSEDEFRRRIEADRMLEYTNYSGNFYGTPMDELEMKLTGDNTVVLIIEVEGAHTVKAKYPDSLCVFIVPPSIEVLRERLISRGTESPEEIERRVAIAARELAELKFYDASIKNIVATDCAQELSDIIDMWQSGTFKSQKETEKC